MKFYTAALLIAAVSSAQAFSVGSSMSSAFGGNVLITGKASTSGATIEMKKGKDNVPPAMRAQYRRQKEMQGMREQMMEAQRPGADGLPVFNLYVRTQRANMWYPCGSFKGDDRSAALCASYRDNGLLAGISKNQLDAGVSGSLFRDQKNLVETIVRGYPQLKKSRDELEFGYKLAYEGLSEEQSTIQVIEVKEQKGFLDGIKSAFGQ
ncbi:hypothetical protein CTEN210_11610 [Chaetoceros tenuissimus]|uniref:PS II complex 12 kDa extrinsic protein n=1 Tax=Chaetoceros tenuissimus TaxID=426638 RepID=A0AAD3D019_9STRA|nr:hypothetical protein CTEN210_11610 [Chaetoceros tenuissimus]